MSATNIPNTCGATANPGKYTLPGLYKQCPNIDGAGKFIVFQRDNLSLISGSKTEMSILLSGVSTQVQNAAKGMITLPAVGCKVKPVDFYKLGLGGIDINEEVKFIALFPQYPVDQPEKNRFIEWAFIDAIDKGELYDMPATGPSASSYTSLDVLQVNRLAIGSTLNYNGGTGPLWIASQGGLLKWNGTDMKLWNTFNSNISSDFVSSVVIDPHGWLWVGTNRGVSKFSEERKFFEAITAENSDLLSNEIRDIALLQTDKIAIATDKGLSIYNYTSSTFQNYTVYNTPELGNNDIRRIHITSDYRIYLATPSGVYEFNYGLNTWNPVPFNSSIPGWSAPDGSYDVSVYAGNLYIGTTGGLVIAPQSGATATTVLAGLSGPLSNSYTTVHYSPKNHYPDRMFFGHPGGFSVYGLTSGIWEAFGSSADFFQLGSGVNDIAVDMSLPASAGVTLFFATEEGVVKNLYTGLTSTYSVVPESNKYANLLMYYPGSADSLYSNHQRLYFEFSKPMNILSFQSVFSLRAGETGAGATVSGTWNWSNYDRTAEFVPGTALEKASPYRISIKNGSTAADGSYLKENVEFTFYTESIIPVLGWNPIGNIMILSGNSQNLVQGIYLRNMNNFEVPVVTMIGI